MRVNGWGLSGWCHPNTVRAVHIALAGLPAPAGYARRMLVEAAWSYRFPARISRAIQVRQEGQPQAVREIAWQAQVLLSRRYRALKARQVAHNKICVAVALELTGFVWSITRQVEVPG